MTLRRGIYILAILMLAAMLASHPCMSQTPSDGLVEFDSAVSLDVPNLVTVYRSADPTKNILFVLPSTLVIDTDSNGKPMFGVIHYGLLRHNKLGVGGRVIATFRADLSPRLQSILPELKKKYPTATFVVPTPASSKVSFLMSTNLGTEEQQLTPDASTLNGPFTIKADLSEAGIRAMLSPASERADIFAARYDFTLRGVNAGSASPTARTFSVGISFSGLCVEHPELFQDLRTQRTGCVVRKKHWWEYLFGLP